MSNYYSADSSTYMLNIYNLCFEEFNTLINYASNEPLFAYGMVIDNRIVNKTIGPKPSDFMKDANFGVYFGKIFWQQTKKE